MIRDIQSQRQRNPAGEGRGRARNERTGTQRVLREQEEKEVQEKVQEARGAQEDAY